ncbi:nuclear transport factor 2 family protein [Kribbella sp. NPDC050470]|uniref:nuclear transport factor 2 family protein n=1 Tax=unclassified Kribbella TaxID=2644121 RepID=UPI00379BE7E5
MVDPEYDGDAAASLADMLDERRHLLEIALWIFGSAATADWIVQETYRRWYDLDDEQRVAIAVPRAWLTRVAGGISLELLAAAATVPATTSQLRFAVPCPPPPSPTPAVQRRAGQWVFDQHTAVVRRFAAACQSGDLAALEAVLAADAVVVSDGGGKVRASIRPVHGARAAARFVAALLSGLLDADLAVQPVNGQAGVVLRRAEQAVAVISLSVAGAEATAVWVVLNPEKLRSWHRPSALDA